MSEAPFHVTEITETQIVILHAEGHMYMFYLRPGDDRNPVSLANHYSEPTAIHSAESFFSEGAEFAIREARALGRL